MIELFFCIHECMHQHLYLKGPGPTPADVRADVPLHNHLLEYIGIVTQVWFFPNCHLPENNSPTVNLRLLVILPARRGSRAIRQAQVGKRCLKQSSAQRKKCTPT